MTLNLTINFFLTRINLIYLNEYQADMGYGTIPHDRTSKIKDRYNLVYWSVFSIGMSIYFPWNTLTTVTSYWNYKLRNVTNDNKFLNTTQDDSTLTELQKIYNSYLSIASMVPNATIVILHALFGHKISIKARLYGAQVCFTPIPNRNFYYFLVLSPGYLH